MARYICRICGFVYDEDKGIPSAGIPPGTKWESLPDDWKCPLCGAPKSMFEKAKDEPEVPTPAAVSEPPASGSEYRELSVGELSALCSNLARGCEKQYLAREMELFLQLADYFKAVVPEEKGDYSKLIELVNSDLDEEYQSAYAAARSDADRGALRALVWSEKTSRMLSSILSRYEKEGSAMLENTGVWVCTICGFVYIGDNPPEKCPVCSVPPWRFKRIEREVSV